MFADDVTPGVDRYISRGTRVTTSGKMIRQSRLGTEPRLNLQCSSVCPSVCLSVGRSSYDSRRRKHRNCDATLMAATHETAATTVTACFQSFPASSGPRKPVETHAFLLSFCPRIIITWPSMVHENVKIGNDAVRSSTGITS